MTVQIITKENFEVEVHFEASWWEFCRLLAPMIEENTNERTDIKVAKVTYNHRYCKTVYFLNIPYN